MPARNDPNSQSSSPRSSLPLKWYLPTFHGDIALERKDAKTTLVRVYELTATEEKALAILRKRATRTPFSGPRWADEKEFAPVSSPQYRTKDGLVITLNAKIEDVEKVLAKALNPKNRLLFTAVKFTDGGIEKIARVPDAEGGTKVPPGKLAPESYRINAKGGSDDKDAVAEGGTKVPPGKLAPESYRINAKGGSDDKDAVEGEPVTEEELRKKRELAAKEKKDKEAKKLKAVATVKEPVIGCPTPEFPEADIRASRALCAFLDDRQIADYEKHGAFVSVGADTGIRYLVCNRETPNRLRGSFPQAYGGGLYSIDEERTLCVHDWDSPPPEEMLALHLCLAIPGMESHVRSLPHALPF